MTSMFERMNGTPCAGCVHMSWDMYENEPGGICTLKLRNRYGAWKGAMRKCARQGYEYYEEEEWKAERALEWAKENAVNGAYSFTAIPY